MAEQSTDEGGKKPEYPEKAPGDELQKMPYTKARRFKPPKQDSYPNNSISGILRKQTI